MDEVPGHVNNFVYFGCVFRSERKYIADTGRRVNAGNSMNGALVELLCSRHLSHKMRLPIYNEHECNINVEQTRVLRSICGVHSQSVSIFLD